MSQQAITRNDYSRAAATIDCDPAALEAVAQVESSGSGFFPDGTPKTLFEGHVFHRLTRGAFSKSNPTISYPVWTREWYGKNWADEKRRLQVAIGLDEAAALMSASWGRFQIMGFNHGACGFSTVYSFVDAMRESEALQLDAFVAFIESRNLADELRELRWADFARLYNGPGYAANNYDVKMALAYRHAKGSLGQK